MYEYSLETRVIRTKIENRVFARVRFARSSKLRCPVSVDGFTDFAEWWFQTFRHKLETKFAFEHIDNTLRAIRVKTDG